MMKKLKINKTDRYILLGTVWVILLSATYTISAVHKQKMNKEARQMEEYKRSVAETINIHIWKKYHQDQMELMDKILTELKNQKKEHIIPVNTKCI